VTREREDPRRPEPGLILPMMRMRLRGSGISGRFIRVGVGWELRVFMDFVYDIMLSASSRVFELVRCVLGDSMWANFLETEIPKTKVDSYGGCIRISAMMLGDARVVDRL
jgi:hypothetical protein